MRKHPSRLIAGIGIVGMMIYGIFLISHLQFSEKTKLATEIPALEPPLSKKTLADQAVQRANAKIGRDPNSLLGYTNLAEAYMQKARETGNSGFYMRAESAIHHVLSQQPRHYEAQRVAAWIALGKHDFSQALSIAKQLQKERSDDYWVYGLLGDAYTELGEYPEAIEAFQNMVDLRPGLPAYSRAAHMRTLHGDLGGATELMSMAVRAGARRDPEPLAWTLVQYGNMHFHQGDIESAQIAYQRALDVFPNYYMALAGMGHIHAGQQQYREAINLFERAIATVPAPDLIANLGDLYALIGQKQEAERQYRLVEFIEQVNDLNRIMYSRQLVLFYADHQRNLEKALEFAESERQRRNDIYTNDALAWVYYRMGRTPEAWKAMEQGLRLGTQDASLLYHAGMIAKGMGDTEKAKGYLTQALALNPYFSPRGAKEAKETLEELRLTVKVHGEGHVNTTSDTQA